MSTDPAALADWIGRTETAAETLTPETIRRFRATLDMDADDAAPNLIHLCLAPPVERPGRLGRDGHPAKGGFLPPVDLPVRMWAGGAYRFSDTLRAGDHVTRASRIDSITPKQGRSGPLCFVTVIHELSTPRGPALSERHDIVYRGEGQVPRPAEPAPRGAHVERVDITPVTLFRYSALTFNGHRIHYDHPYATEVEGYPGLVIHGPLQATLLYHFAARLMGAEPARFEFRNRSPLFIGDTVELHATPEGAGELHLWTAAQGGPVAMEGRVARA